MTEIQKYLFSKADKKYKDFTSKLTPNIDPNKVIGVKIPEIKNYAKELYKNGNYKAFLSDLPHCYQEENILHALLLGLTKDYDTCIEEVERFLPYIDNWAVSDTCSPKISKKNMDDLLNRIYKWVKSEHTYVVRYSISMLMKHYLDNGNFKEEYLEIPLLTNNEDYYVKMMVAWFYSTALVKQFNATLPYLLNKRLDPWTHNKTISKCVDSYRFTLEQKNYLKTLRILNKQ